MARETVRDFRVGERLTAEHVNLLNKAARIVFEIRPGSYSLGGQKGVVGLEPTFIRPLVVIDGWDYGNLSEVRVRYRYKDIEDVWQTDDIDPNIYYFMDCTPVGVIVTPGCHLSAYWDSQGQKFIPLEAPMLYGRTTQCHSRGTAAPIEIGPLTLDIYNLFADLQPDTGVIIGKVSNWWESGGGDPNTPETHYHIIAANPCQGMEEQCGEDEEGEPEED